MSSFRRPAPVLNVAVTVLPLLVLVASLLLRACGPVSGTGSSTRPTALPVASSTSPTRPVVIDTDMAADDWMALLYLLRRPDVSVKAITVRSSVPDSSNLRHALMSYYGARRC